MAELVNSISSIETVLNIDQKCEKSMANLMALLTKVLMVNCDGY